MIVETANPDVLGTHSYTVSAQFVRYQNQGVMGSAENQLYILTDLCASPANTLTNPG